MRHKNGPFWGQRQLYVTSACLKTELHVTCRRPKKATYGQTTGIFHLYLKINECSKRNCYSKDSSIRRGKRKWTGTIRGTESGGTSSEVRPLWRQQDNFSKQNAVFSPFLLPHVESVLIYYLASPNKKLEILSRPLRGKAHLENLAFVWKNPVYAPGSLTWSATKDNKRRHEQLLKRLTLHYPARMKINWVTKDMGINLKSALTPRPCREAKTTERWRIW